MRLLYLKLLKGFYMLYTSQEASSRIQALRKNLSKNAHVEIIPDINQPSLNRILIIDYIDRKPTEKEIKAALCAFDPNIHKTMLLKAINKIPFDAELITYDFKDHSKSDGIVLCKLSKDHEPFVVWRFFMAINQEYELYSGSYHETFEEAQAVYSERGKA